jgi:hypothetical protein
MAERRSLTEGLKPAPTVNPDVERDFVFQKSANTAAENTKPPVNTSPSPNASNTARSPLSSRIRADLAAALKRASLERQLAQVEPNTISDILEITLEPWLREHGYLN